MIKVLKASAGSGKTYQLSKQYREILLREPFDEFAYRHILAVTFTNKATDEMKARILKDLYEEYTSGSKNAAHAGILLKNMLHDYSAFAVSTIDKFFQHTLRSFARELGKDTSYQIELDKKMLACEAVDRIIDSLGKDPAADEPLISFILESMEEMAKEGKAPKIDEQLKDMAVQLKSEKFILAARKIGLDVRSAYNTQSLSEMKSVCNTVVGNYCSKVRLASKSVMDTLDSCGVAVSDFYGGEKKSWLSPVRRNAGLAPKKIPDSPTDTFIARANDPSAWFSKASSALLPKVQGRLEKPLRNYLDSFNEKEEKVARTAAVILKGIYGLSVAARLWDTFDAVTSEKGVICLDESNMMLKDIIDGSDAPFIYEKTGTRIDHYLLDEFQDTSLVQWDNFLPLLKESASHDPGPEVVHNLVVGDVKQCIYRWRESDWNLLDSRVEKDLPAVKSVSLDQNFRSGENIINFNNEFYKWAAGYIDGLMSDCIAADSSRGGDSPMTISSLYADVQQKPGKSWQLSSGEVEWCFVGANDNQAGVVLEKLKDLHEKGVKWGEMAVLVRKNSRGTEVAQALVGANIPVITEASLRIKNSLSVRLLVSLLHYVDNPSDRINVFLAKGLGLDTLPTSYHSISSLCDTLFGILRADEKYREICESEVMYISAFIDYVTDYTSLNGNNLRSFLRDWKNVDPSISSPLGTDAVNILTIHKSKGLAFPWVVIPFLEGISLYHRPTEAWCAMEGMENTPLEKYSGLLFNVTLDNGSLKNAFADNYRQERFNQAIDAINMAYVATTRAEKGMVLIGKLSEKGGRENFAAILNSFINRKNENGE